MPTVVRRPFLFTPIVAFLVLLSIVSLALAVDVAWVRWRIIDTQGYVSTIAKPLAADPQVKDALADELAGQLIGQGNFSRRLQELVPAPLKSSVGRLAGDIEQEWKTMVRPTIRKQLDQREFQTTWERANVAAHAQLIAALGDEANARSVTLDLHPVLQAAMRDVGRAIEPQTGTPGLAVAIFDGLAEALPSDLGKIAVDLGQVGQVERMLIRQADTLLVGLLVTGGLAAAFAIALARRRGGVVALIGGGVMIVSGLTWWLVATQAVDAGERALAASGATLTRNLQVVVETQTRLATDSFARWQAAAVAAGTVLVLIGLFGQAALTSRGRNRGSAGAARSNMQYPSTPPATPPYAAAPSYAPAGSQYAPASGSQYAPAGSQYAPASDSQYAPPGSQYAPGGSPYAPSAGSQYAPYAPGPPPGYPSAPPYGDHTAVMPAAPSPAAGGPYDPSMPGERTVAMPAAPAPGAGRPYDPSSPSEQTPPSGTPTVAPPPGEHQVPPPWRPRTD